MVKRKLHRLTFYCI